MQCVTWYGIVLRWIGLCSTFYDLFGYAGPRGRLEWAGKHRQRVTTPAASDVAGAAPAAYDD
eukprot:3636622-Prymnesium_polylepis.1